MLLVAIVLVGAGWPAVTGRTVPPSAVEVGLTELQHLEDVLENEALQESLGPFKEVRRFTRERPVESENERPGAVDVEAAGKLAEPGSASAEDKGKRVTREEPEDEMGVERTSRQTKDHRTGGEQRHFHSGMSPQGYPSSPSLSPHVTFNVPPPQVQYTIAHQVAAPRPLPLPVPVSNCAGGSCSSGGTTIHVHDTHLITQHVPQTYTATVPFISGYRLTPIIGHKQITVNDNQGGGGGIHATYPVGGDCTSDPYSGYWQHLYTHGRNVLTAEDLLRPFEEARYFQEPIVQEHHLSDHKEYSTQIDDLKHQIEHLESLRENVPVTENLIAR